MTTRMSVGFNITFVEEDVRLATLFNYMCPEDEVFSLHMLPSSIDAHIRSCVSYVYELCPII